ncbi:MAG: acyl-CoA dehydrogenase C-terminal domain-containing protein, partial [Dietzia sp.]
ATGHVVIAWIWVEQLLALGDRVGGAAGAGAGAADSAGAADGAGGGGGDSAGAADGAGAGDSAGAGADAFAAGKVKAAEFFLRRELPIVDAKFDLLASGDRTTLDMRDEWF